ncbi:MAG: class I SAM-dependent methyltransferase [Candidatus Nitricoxidivorans perseverans]|uniref:Class I SAM-dependent methyltransferase n=1 Tax=Candidatus Nitricoxidivorans perseverans TaxID=2975601 RepID=A0AA49FKF5_9PROT|nr:MAG: class I SAM-dependent methyltransferase [Candidatus Nitricoxidivorans perseverans]
MRESTKTNQYRSPDFFTRYLSGSVLDIGCGDDPVVPHARPFDVEHGDANSILEFLSPESFDTVNSSHCLEHMRDVPRALREWWRLVRPGGFMILVVPHEDLYEQGFWPSLHNRDHKATFRIGGDSSWSPVSRDLAGLVKGLDDAEIIEIGVQDNGYRREWRVRLGERVLPRPSPFGRFLDRMRHSMLKRLRKAHSPREAAVADFLNRTLARLGIPIDQTKTGALAQIQCIVRKRLRE